MVWIASTNWVSDVAEDLLSAGGSEDPVADTESAAASAIEPVGGTSDAAPWSGRTTESVEEALDLTADVCDRTRRAPARGQSG